MGSTKSKRHGRIRLCSGDSPTPLEKTALFTEGDFSFTVTKNINQLLDRGILTEFRRGDDAAVEWSFSAKFQDRTLRETLDEFVWDSQTELIGGLVGGALNSGVATTLGIGYKAGTLFVTDGAPYTKLAADTVPTVAGEYSENTGTVDEEGVLVNTTFEVFQPAADTDVNVFYGAVGESDTPAADCSDVKTLVIKLDFFDPCNPSTIEETYTFAMSALTEVTQEEGDEFDTISFSGISLIRRPVITPAGPPPP